MELRWWNKGGRGLEINDFVLNDRAFKDGSKTATQLTWDWPFPQWTRSIDAALTLLPPDRLWSVGKRVNATGYVVSLDNYGKSFTAATPALAIVAAALRDKEASHD